MGTLNLGSSGTITNLAVGGLPDDSVALADLSATGTASSSTFLRGDNTWAAAGGGKLLQVVQGTTATEVSSTPTSMADTGLTASITPETNC